MAGHYILRCVTVILLLASFSLATSKAATVNSKIDRIIDLSSQLVKITEKILIESDGPKSSLGSYLITIDPTHRERLSYIEARYDDQQLDLVEKSAGTYEVDLSGHNLKLPLIVTSVYSKLLQPYPAEISQNDRQFVRYIGIQTSLSPYLTKTITTRIKLPTSSRLESFSKANKMTTGTNKLTYGPFKDVEPNKPAEPLVIHFENNSPFVAVTEFLRTIELSPWANTIHVANEVKVAHVGAKLKGSFSRLEYQRDHSNGVSSVKSFNAELPKVSKDIYFRDGIGNISTSNVRSMTGKTLVSIKPRFPLFGGWVTDFVLGYKLPMKDFIEEPTSADSRYTLSIPFSDVLYENMLIDGITVKIYLPAGSKSIEIEPNQINFERSIDDFSYSYLDIVGRPVVILKKNNVVAQHFDGRPIVIKFTYSKLFLLQEPLLLMAVAILATILAAIYTRMSSPGNKSKID